MNQAQEILNKLRASRPSGVGKRVSDIDCGTMFVLSYINKSKGDVYASSISEAVGVSRARIAVLLNKMIKKNLIAKSPSAKDARIDVISLTKNGINIIKKFEKERLTNISKIIQTIGYEKTLEFVDTAIQIKDILDL